MTKFIIRVSLFLTVITVIYCTLTGVPLQDSLIRGGTVFVGTYAIISAGLVGFKLIVASGMRKGVDVE
ncbi:hypothetical protein MJD09_18585 [bacterium]|nr:hypothetical protein [bacterium]